MEIHKNMLSFIIHCNLIFHALWHFFFPEGEGLRIASSHSMTNNMQLIKVLLLARLHFYMKNKKERVSYFLVIEAVISQVFVTFQQISFFSLLCNTHCFIFWNSTFNLPCLRILHAQNHGRLSTYFSRLN